MNLPSLIDAANHLLSIMEAPRRGLKHQAHSKHVAPARRRVQAVMRHFWARQRAALLAEVKPRIQQALDAFPLRESSPRAGQFSSTLLPHSLQPLRFAVTKGEADEYHDAISSAIEGAAATFQRQMAEGEIDGEGYAGRYLRDNSLTKLTGEINDTTTGRLRNAVADAWEQGGSYDQIVKALTDTFDDFDETRAGLIAQTEVADGYNWARQSIASDLGYDEHAWETESGEPCPECEANEAQGWLDIDEDFQSGDDAPTAHPNCLCVVNFRKSSEEE